MIKADGSAKVKQALTLAALVAFAMAWLSPALPAFAAVSEDEIQLIEEQEHGIEGGKKQKKPEEPSVQQESPPEDYQKQAEPERVRSIEAEEFRVRFLKTSRSGKIYLFEDLADNRPRPGRILLIKQGNDDILAARVLKNYSGKFAAKVVLPINPVKPDTEYRAIKKLGDKIVALIKERENRGKDLDASKTDEDLAKEVAPDDNELDRGIPQPKAKTKPASAKPEGTSGPASLSKNSKMPEPLFNREGGEIDSFELNEEEAFADITVQDDLPIEQHRHAFSFEYGSIKNVDKDSKPATYSSYGARYGFNLWRMAMLQRKNIQDMFTLELGLFYIPISNFAKIGDNVVVYPLIGTLRYSVLLGESISLFAYTGFSRGSVSEGPDQSLAGQHAKLARAKALFGVGGMLKIGPAWAARIDVGSDMFGIGAVLKF